MGAIRSRSYGIAASIRFNPRPRDGGDPKEPTRGVEIPQVSIRAPVMGAMGIAWDKLEGYQFQSAPP